MVVSWPRRIKDKGGLREQFTHCIDIAPTILEVAGIPEPVRVDGIEQKPIEGTSFAYTFSEAGAEERHTRQYFESFGYYGMYKDGWWASCKPFRIPWDITQGDAEQVRSRRLRPGRAGVGALLPAGRLLAGQGHRGGEPGEARGGQGRLLGGRRAIQRAADARGIQRVLRHPAADGRPDEVQLPLRRAERRLGDDPEALRALVLDQRRPRGARRRR